MFIFSQSGAGKRYAATAVKRGTKGALLGMSTRAWLLSGGDLEVIFVGLGTVRRVSGGAGAGAVYQ